MSIIPLLIQKKKLLGTLLNQNELEVTAYIAGLTTPLSSGQITKLNTFVSSLKTGMNISSLSDAFDAMWLLGGETKESSYRNIVKNLHHITTPSEPAWTQGQGSLGDGISQYLNTNFNASTQGVNYTLNNNGFGVLTPTSRALSLSKGHGTSAGSINNKLSLYHATNQSRNYSYSNTYAPLVVNTTVGMTSVFRDSSTNIYAARNKSVTSNIASNVSGGLHNLNHYLLAVNAAGTAQSFDDVELQFAYISRALTSDELTVLYDAVTAFFLS